MPRTSKTEKKSKKSEKEEKKEEKKEENKKTKSSKNSKSSKSSKTSRTKKRGPGRPPKSETKSGSQKKKTTSKAKKESTKSVKPKSKAKSVIVDVIKDDDDVEFYRSSAEDVFDTSDEDIEPEVLANRAQDLPIDGESRNDYTTEKSEFHLSEGEIDNQKKYYRELSLEIEKSRGKEKEEDIADEEIDEILEDEFEGEGESKVGKNNIKNIDTNSKKNKDGSNEERRLGLYTRYVWRFLAVVFVLVFLVFFLSFSSLKINLIPKTETLNDNTLIKVVTAESERQASFIDPREEINGVIEEIELNFEEEYSSTGEEYVGEEIVGRVKIINDYSRAQPLVRETRLHSPEGKEFRINEAVNIPAGGEVWVDIYADNPTRDLAIEPTTFTIPGLWAGLQDYIYAESEEAFSYKQKKEKYIRTSDIARAKNESESKYNLKLEQKIESRKKELQETTGKEMAAVYINDYIKTSTEAESDEKLDSFAMSVEGSARVAFFNKEDLKKIALGKLNLLIPDGKELINFNEDDINLIFQNYDSDSKTAQIKANFTGEMILKNNENPINKENLVDLKEPQIEAFLNSKEEIKDYELIFKPGFIKKAPRLVDRIEINVVED